MDILVQFRYLGVTFWNDVILLKISPLFCWCACVRKMCWLKKIYYWRLKPEINENTNKKQKKKQRRYKLSKRKIKYKAKEVTVSVSELYVREFIATLDHQLESNYRYNLFNSEHIIS